MLRALPPVWTSEFNKIVQMSDATTLTSCLVKFAWAIIYLNKRGCHLMQNFNTKDKDKAILKCVYQTKKSLRILIFKNI